MLLSFPEEIENSKLPEVNESHKEANTSTEPDEATNSLLESPLLNDWKRFTLAHSFLLKMCESLSMAMCLNHSFLF